MSEALEKHAPQSNKMGTMPVPRLLISMALPLAASMLVQALYNIVDSIFVAQIGEKALTAVSMAFPVQSLMIAVASGTGVGVNALLSRSLGEKKPGEAHLAAVNGVFLAFLSACAFCLFGLFFSRTYFRSQVADPEIIAYGTQYLEVVAVLCFGSFGAVMFERILQSTGKTVCSMLSQGGGAITNIILDPIMIFGLFGFPALGIRGAAIATVIGQFVAMFIALYSNLTRNQEISLNMRGFRPDPRVISVIYAVGFPSIIMQSITSIMTYCLNLILIDFSATAVTILGIYFKLQSFIFMPVFGLTNAMIPIIAYNYGARSRERILATCRWSIGIAVTIMLIGLGVFQVFTSGLLMLFNASENLLAMGVPALRTISFSFILAGYCICVTSAFQALGNGLYSLINSVMRQLVCILPLAYAFAHVWGLNAVWLAFPAAELVSAVLATLLFGRIYHGKVRDLDRPA